MVTKGLLRLRSSVLGEQRGIVLAEALVALALLGILGTGLISALTTSTTARGRVEEEVAAHNLARAQMEYTKNAPYIAYVFGNPDVPPNYARIDDPGNPDAVDVPAGYSIGLSAQALNQPDDGIQEITVIVSRDGRSLVTLRTYKVNR